jgi:hypothetical protein
MSFESEPVGVEARESIATNMAIKQHLNLWMDSSSQHSCQLAM